MAKYCDEYVDLSVYPLAYLENHVAELHHFCTLPVSEARSSFDGVATRCVGLLPVLRMTSCFHTVTLWHVMCVRLSSESVTIETTASTPTTICSTESKSVVYDFLV